jgi:RND superfamily putative drug exporter
MNGQGRDLPGAAARWIVRLRFLLVPGWIALSVLALVYLPSIFAANTGTLDTLLPSSSKALVAESRALETFGLPFASGTLAVARQNGPLARRQVGGAADYIAAVDEQPSTRNSLRVLPVPDLGSLLRPRSPDKTLLTYLYMDPALSEGEQEKLADRFAAGLQRAAAVEEVELTGPVPAGWSQRRIGQERLHWLELATTLIVIALLALYFRAPGIPFLGLATVGVAYSVAVHLLGWLGEHVGIEVPSEVGPVIVALLFGALTDYVVFFISGWRRRLAEGEEPLRAVELVTAELLPVVLTAALMIAGSTATLLLSGVKFLTVFAPGLAISVLVGAAVAVTFIPSSLAVIGPRLLWPRGAGEARSRREEKDRPRAKVVAFAARHAVPVLLLCLVPLGAAAYVARYTSLGDPIIRGLPPSNSARQGYELVSGAFGPGVVGPTMVMVERTGIAADRDRLAALQAQLEETKGVDLVLGPADDPFHGRRGVFLAPGGEAARFVLVLEEDPSGEAAVGTLQRVEARLPGMVSRAGLPGAQTLVGGETAITAELNARTHRALVRVLPAAVAILFLLLWMLLGSKLAAACLVGVSVLTVAAALGITYLFFQVILGYGELAFFVPIAAAILLLALGSDYNVFFVSRIWNEAEHVGLETAIRVAGSRAGRAVTLAGMILVLSFATVALVPILAFRELAFAICIGLLLDTLVARTLLVPALVSLFGRARQGSDEPRYRRGRAGHLTLGRQRQGREINPR